MSKIDYVMIALGVALLAVLGLVQGHTYVLAVLAAGASILGVFAVREFYLRWTKVRNEVRARKSNG